MISWLSCGLVLASVLCPLSVISRSYSNGLIFYELKSHKPYLPPTVSVSRGRNLASVKYSDKGSIWSTFGQPCECQGPVCGCCAGLKVDQYRFDQKGEKGYGWTWILLGSHFVPIGAIRP